MVVALCAACWAAGLSAQVRGTYLYHLSNFTGRIPYSFARVLVDQEGTEIYVVYGNMIRIFNPSGMEVYSIGDDLDLGLIADAAGDRNGNIIILSYKDSRPLVTRCDFRGVPEGAVEIKGLPESVAFGPNRMVARNGLLYFVSTSRATVVVTDSNGAFREHIELFTLIDLQDVTARQKEGAELTGFSVDGEGNILFTIAVLFKAYRLSPDRKMAEFGRPGSAPGRFGIVAGIVADSRGNLIVADKLKSVIMVFDRNFGFVTEFGRYGSRPGNLVRPDDLAIDGRDRLYVTQGGRRGVSVFALAAD